MLEADDWPVVWRSTNPSVASVTTINGAALVTAVMPGVTAVWAVRGRDSTSASVEVMRTPCLASPTLSPASATLVTGDSVRAEAQGGSCTPSDTGFGWSSADAALATVELRENSGGRSVAIITAKAPGQVVITAHSIDDPTVTGSVAVTVRAP